MNRTRRCAFLHTTDELPVGMFVVAGFIWFISFAIVVMLLPFPSSTGDGAISAFALSGHDGGGDPSRRLSPLGTTPGATLAPDRVTVGTIPGVTPAPDRVTDVTERDLSVRGLREATSEGGWGRDTYGLLLRRGTLRTLTNVDTWSNFSGIARGLPYDWHLATFQEKIPPGLKGAIMRCPGASCPDVAPAAQKDQQESSEEEDSSPGKGSGSAISGQTVSPSSDPAVSMEITYDPSPPSVAPPTLALFCDSRLPMTPTPFLVACDTAKAGMVGSWGVSFQYYTLEGALDSDQWHLSVDMGSGFRVVVASAVPDLLDEFGVSQIRSANVQVRQGLQLSTTSASQQVLKNAITPTGEFFAGITSQGASSGYFAGITSQGPAGGFQITSGQFGAQITAIASRQVQLAGTILYQAGDFGLGYTLGTDGSGLIGRFTRGPFDLAVALTGSDLQVGLSYTPEGGPTVQATWSGTDGFAIALTASFKISLGPAGHGPALEPFDPSVELPLGPANLVLSPPFPSDGPSPPSIDFKWSLPGPAQPATPPTPSSGAGATLVVRTCVVAERVDTCRPGDAILPLRILVDGTSMKLKGEEIPVSPGHHLVVIPRGSVPQGLAPLRGLTCDLTVPASTTGTCELPFRRQVGTPDRNPDH